MTTQVFDRLNQRRWAMISTVVALAVLQGCGGGGSGSSSEQSAVVSASGSAATSALTVQKSGTGTGTVTSNPAGDINCGSVCTADIDVSRTVTLVASAGSGSIFGGWSGACAGTGTCSVSMASARNVGATFTLSAQGTSYTLTVASSGTGSGTVTSTNVTGINCGSSCSATYSSGQSVTLAASAGSGSTFSGWGGACSGTGTCTVSMTAARSVTASFSGQVAASPTGVYTDLDKAPVGAYVTVYGIDSAVSSWPVHSHGTKSIGGASGIRYTVVQVPASAPALTVNGQSVPVTVISGRVIEVTTSTLNAAFNAIQPGDVLYLHAGTYTGHYGPDTYWNESNFVIFSKQGTAAQPIALVAYPGESVTIDNTGSGGNARPNFYLGDSGGGRMAAYLTIAGFNLRAQQEVVSGGGNTANSSTPESGGHHVRVVGCSLVITDTSSNTMTGLLSIQGDGWKVLGNTIEDPVSRSIINNNHGIYVQNGADDVEIAYNSLLSLRMGHTIQVHQDGTPMLYSNVWIHDNLIQGAATGDDRGISVSNVDVASTVTVENNTIRNVGQAFGGITVYRGQVAVRNNTFENVAGPGIDVNGNYGGSRTVTESGNTYTNCSSGSFLAENGASLSDILHQ